MPDQNKTFHFRAKIRATPSEVREGRFDLTVQMELHDGVTDAREHRRTGEWWDLRPEFMDAIAVIYRAGIGKIGGDHQNNVPYDVILQAQEVIEQCDTRVRLELGHTHPAARQRTQPEAVQDAGSPAGDEDKAEQAAKVAPKRKPKAKPKADQPQAGG